MTHRSTIAAIIVFAVAALPGPLAADRTSRRADARNLDDPAAAAAPADSAAPIRGSAGDLWADAILGQADFGQVTPNRVQPNRVFNPNGVLVDRTVTPNRVYVYDAGNSRVLGLAALGACVGGATAGAACTSTTDCVGGACALNRDRPADIVLGQPGGTDQSACNGDGAFQHYPVPAAASARTLCLLRVDQLSILEGGSAATMAVDADGDLYVPDFFNNRVLRYNRPFETDTVADQVWGQADFNGYSCNLGRGDGSAPTAAGLCLAPPNGHGTIEAGVAVGPGGDLWVTDKMNHRVLRYPADLVSGVPAPLPDLVLGQPDFFHHDRGLGLDQLNAPGSLRVAADGTVFVADTYNSRVLAYQPPLASGMAATYQLGSGLDRPPGLELGPDGALWVNDAFNQRVLRFRGRVLEQTLRAYASGDWGGIGVDRAGALLQSGWTFQSLVHHPAPRPSDTTLSPDAYLLSSARNFRSANEVQAGRLWVVNGMEVAGDQLVVADADRLLFWNAPAAAASGAPADGVVGQPDLGTMGDGGYFGRPDADRAGRLWVSHSGASIRAYRLPLVSGAAPVIELRSPLPLAGGGSFAWTDSVAIGDLAIDASDDRLWASDRDNNRVFRVRDLAGRPTVDYVLGQPKVTSTGCNHGLGPKSPGQDALCAPGGLAFDSRGNLFVSDHAREFDGNHRLLMWADGSFEAAPARAVFGTAASRVFGRSGSFGETSCLTPLCAPFHPAFDRADRLVVGLNPYIAGFDAGRFPLVFDDILADTWPSSQLADYFSMSLQGAFDRFGNLYQSDHNRSRVLVYRQPFGGDGRMPTSTPTSEPTLTPTIAPTLAPPTVAATATPPPTSTVRSGGSRVWLPVVWDAIPSSPRPREVMRKLRPPSRRPQISEPRVKPHCPMADRSKPGT